MATLRQRKGKQKQSFQSRATNKSKRESIDGSSHSAEIQLRTLSDWDQCKQMFALLISQKWILCMQWMAVFGHIITRLLFPIVVGFAISPLTSNSEQIIVSDGIMDLLCTNSIILDCRTKHSLLNTTLYLMIFVNLGQTFFNFARGYFGQLLSQRISATIRNQTFHSMLAQDLSFFIDTESGTLLHHLSADCNEFTSFCTKFIPKIMNNALGILFSLSYALFISPSLTFIMLISVPITSMLSRHFSSFYSKLSQKLQTMLAKATNIAFESISNIKTIKAFSNELEQTHLFAKEIAIGYNYSAQIALHRALFEASITILFALSTACVMWYLAKLYESKQINAGNTVSFIILSIQISNYMKRSMNIYSDFVKNIAATKRIFILMNRVPNIGPFGGHNNIHAKPTQSAYSFDNPLNIKSIDDKFGDLVVSDDSFEGNIEFKNVCFCYPSRPNMKVIDDLSFCVTAGEAVGIVGESGNGKSTMLALLMRLFDPSSGDILIDDINLRQYNLKWLHQKQIGYVQQEPSLFNVSIKANICMNDGASEVEMERVIDASKRAQCYSFIQKLDKGFDTVCGERGTQLSGGQKQRISIAGAIYNNPRILILDEASSALDAENEYLLHQTIKNMQKNEKKMTIIIIAHRLSSIKHANKVLVVKNGKIVQCGPHSQLIQIKDGEYFKLIQRQVFVD